MTNISYRSLGFPRSTPTQFGTMAISNAKLCWAAITVGRPSRAAVRSFGEYSTYEALYRWNMVRASIKASSYTGSFENTDLFNALDPTEKGGVNFYLGMIFAKIAAQDLLQTPWLIHYHWMTAQHRIGTKPGYSTPDLLGLSSTTGKWSAFEAKGRTAGYSTKLMNKAKSQARQVKSVDGQDCDMHIGSQLYRNSYDELKFAWEDPAVDEIDPIDLFTNRDMWRRYYAVAHTLYQEQRETRSGIAEQLGFKVDLTEEALAFIEVINSDQKEYSQELDTLIGWSRAQYENPTSEYAADGIYVHVIEE